MDNMKNNWLVQLMFWMALYFIAGCFIRCAIYETKIFLAIISILIIIGIITTIVGDFRNGNNN